MRAIFKSLLAIGLLMFAPAVTPAQGQESKPIAVVSVASYDELMANIGFVGELSGQPDLANSIEGFLKLFTQGQGLNGLDHQSPWGIVINEDTSVVGFLPVTNLNNLLSALSGIIGEPGRPDSSGVIRIITPQGQPVSIKQVGNWALIGPQAEAFANLPADPGALLGNLPENYDLGIQLNIQNIPPMFRDLAISQLSAGVESSLQQLPDEEEASFEARRKMVEKQVESIERIFNEVDVFTIGLQIDQKGQTSHLDATVTALPNTRTAAQIAANENLKTAFAGFVLPGSSFTGTMTANLTPEDQADAIESLDVLKAQALQNLKREDKRAEAEEVLNAFIDVVTASIKSGKIDGAGSMTLAPASSNFIFGFNVADGAQFEAALKKAARLAETEKDFPGVTENAATHQGVRFHKIVITTPDDESKKFFGDSVDLYFGVGKNAGYIASGAGSLELIKQAIDKSQSEQATIASHFVFDLGGVLKFANTVDSTPTLQNLVRILENTNGQDHVTVESKIENGTMQYRIHLEPGVLRLLGQIRNTPGAN